MKIILRKFLSVIFTLAVFSIFFSANCEKDDENPVFPPDEGFELINTYNTPGTATSVIFKRIQFSNYLIIADGSSGIIILNVNNPPNPVLAGSYDTQGYCSDITSDSIGNQIYLFVSDGANGLQILNITNPQNPQAVLSVPFSGDEITAMFFDRFNKRLYAGTYNGSLKIYDASGLPFSLSQIGSSVLFNSVSKIIVRDSLCYITEPDYGVEVFNTINPNAPARTGYFNSPGEPEDIVLMNNYAFIADGSAGVTVANISNPNNILYAATIPTEDDAKYLYADNNKIFVSEGVYGIESFDISEPLDPDRTGSYNSSGIPYRMAGYVEYLFLADGNNGLVILKIR